MRCALLSVDPAQAGRLRDVDTNHGDRIAEAEQNNWLGEVEGLMIGLAAADAKLDALDKQQTSPAPMLITIATRGVAPGASHLRGESR